MLFAMRMIDIDNVNHLCYSRNYTIELRANIYTHTRREITSNVCKYLEIEFQIRTIFLTNNRSIIIGQRVMVTESVSVAIFFSFCNGDEEKRNLIA